MTLEEANWRLSTMPGWAIGIRDRGFIREGMPADIVVYDLEKLAVKPMEAVHDLPEGDWRRVQKATGYRYTIVNGEVTLRTAFAPEPCPANPCAATTRSPANIRLNWRQLTEIGRRDSPGAHFLKARHVIPAPPPLEPRRFDARVLAVAILQRAESSNA